MTENKALIVSAKIEDPVIKAKRRKLDLIETMAKRFKRIDIKFLTIVKQGNTLPSFAVLPVDDYRSGSTCSFNGYMSGYDDGLFRDLFSKMTSLSSGTATPAHQIPDDAEAILSEVKGDFDRVLVAWEAEWQPLVDADPLMIGEIDGIWFLLAKWDTTKLESYVAQN